MPGQPDRPNPPLPDEVCAETGKQLQLTLVELIALSLAGKQLQWSSYGHEFVSVRHHLQQLVDEWRALEDVVAERAAAIGMALDGTAAAVIELDDQRPLKPASPRSHGRSSGCTHSSSTSRTGSANAESCSLCTTPSLSTCSSGSSANSKSSFGCCGHSWLTRSSLPRGASRGGSSGRSAGPIARNRRGAFTTTRPSLPRSDDGTGNRELKGRAA